jgi:hypothetical protein
MLHDAPLGTVLKAIEEITALPCIKEPPAWMRVETLLS